MRPPKSRSSARTAKPPPPVWMGMPSALAISVPAGSVMKQEKSWLWLKIGLRAVRVITQPMWRLTWSSRFCISARITGSRTPLPAAGAVAAAAAATAIMKLPARSTSSASPGPSSTVVVCSSMTAGPVTRAPTPSRRPSCTALSSQPCPSCQTGRDADASAGCAGAGSASRAFGVPVTQRAATCSAAARIAPPGCTCPYRRWYSASKAARAAAGENAPSSSRTRTDHSWPR